MAFCTRHAVEGKNMSGVTVQRMMAFTSEAATPRCASAQRAASMAISEVAIPAGAMWRSRIPTLSRIHWSFVSTIFSRS